jgi:recyclin-1
MGTSSSLYINNKPLNELIPGLKLDPFTARSRARSTGKAREVFSQFYIRLYPFYVDLRHASGESMVLSEFGSEPEECGRILNKLVGIGKCKVVDDWRQVKFSHYAPYHVVSRSIYHIFVASVELGNRKDMPIF